MVLLDSTMVLLNSTGPYIPHYTMVLLHVTGLYFIVPCLYFTLRLLHSTSLYHGSSYYILLDSASLCHGSAIHFTGLYFTLPQLYLALLHCTMALLGSTSLYHGSTWLYFTIHSTIYVTCSRYGWKNTGNLRWVSPQQFWALHGALVCETTESMCREA